jgi:hypothetical protein
VWFSSFLEKGIGEAGEPPETHPDRQVGPFHVAGGDVLFVGAPGDGVLLGAKALGGAVTVLALGSGPVHFNELREVDPTPQKASSTAPRYILCPAVVSCTRFTKREARSCMNSDVPRADQEGRHQFRVRVDGLKGPDIGHHKLTGHLGGHVLRLGIDEAPDSSTWRRVQVRFRNISSW